MHRKDGDDRNSGEHGISIKQYFMYHLQIDALFCPYYIILSIIAVKPFTALTQPPEHEALERGN